MKLRNKKTGEIVSLEGELLFDNEVMLLKQYDSLAELNEEWEDYYEPKESYYIDCDGEIYEPVRLNESDLDKMTSIGNYFKSREEAEKAVEKLKAWERLKDTGCKPIMWRWKQDYPNDACYVEVVLKCQFDSGVHDKELDLLFGGEE